MVLLIIGQYFAADPMHHWMMDDSTISTSTNWQVHFSEEIRQAVSNQDATKLVATIRAGLATQTLQQVDLFNENCMCAVSLKTFLESEAATYAESINKLLQGTLTENQTLTYGMNPIPIDLDYLHNRASEHAHHGVSHGNHLKAIDHDTHVHLVSDIKYMLLASGDRIGIRIHLNFSSSAQSHTWMLIGMGALITLLAALVLYPSERFIRRSHIAEEMSLEKAKYLAEHDPLTGFLNRYGFSKRAKQVLDTCKAANAEAYMIIYDADNFKDVNDQHGHDTGDQMLIKIAEMLRDFFPEGTVAGRLGGDEFAVLITKEELGDDDSFFASLDTRLSIHQPDLARELEISASAGYATFPEHGDTLEDLMKAADLALLSIKKISKSSIGPYDFSMLERFERRIWEIEGIQDAAKNNKIAAYYQPIVTAGTGEICLLEALARWDHPEQGILPPGAFQCALEDPTTARLLTGAMLDRVTRDLKDWWSEGLRIPISLNLGQDDLKQSELPDMLCAALDRYELPSDALLVEVTESAVNANNLTEVLAVLEEINARHIQICLDDFGTGTSSITLLRALPCAKLKIDKSFVDGVVSNMDDNAIIRALTRLGHDLNMRVVAEGVETQEQEEILRGIGADYLQGYLFAAPIQKEQMTTLINERGLTNLYQSRSDALHLPKFAI